MSHVACARISGDDAFDLVDRVVAAPLYVRDGQLRHTLLLDPNGLVLADTYVGNDDGAYMLFAEGLSAAALVEHLEQHRGSAREVFIENLSETHTMLSIDGPFAWELIAALEGQEVVGFPYLSFFRPLPDRWLLRAGKTGEFGYDLLVPRGDVDAVSARVLDVGQRFDLHRVGMDALWHCALENWFFNVHVEGRAGLTPEELQLQWRMAPDKEFVGAAAVRARRERGPSTRRIAGVVADEDLCVGDTVTFEGRAIGSIVSAARSLTTDEPIGIALLERRYAHSGIDRHRVDARDRSIRVTTVSPPFVNNVSLFVNPQRHSYVARAEIPFPGATRRVLM